MVLKFLTIYLTRNINNFKISKIEEIGQEEVFDFTMEEGTPYGFVNGILVHNCIGKKKHKKMAELRKDFLKDCPKNNIEEQDGKAIFDKIEKSAAL